MTQRRNPKDPQTSIDRATDVARRIMSPKTEHDHELMWTALVLFLLGFIVGT